MGIWKENMTTDPLSIDFDVNELEHNKILFGNDLGYQTADVLPSYS